MDYDSCNTCLAEVCRHTEEGEPQVLNELCAGRERCAHRCVKPVPAEHAQQRQRQVRQQVVHVAHLARVVPDLWAERTRTHGQVIT